jgi:DNA-binding Lrp family transcriptional regulator
MTAPDRGYYILARNDHDIAVARAGAAGIAVLAELTRRARHVEGSVKTRFGEVELGRGQALVSVTGLAERLRLDRRAVQRALDALESENIIVREQVSVRSRRAVGDAVVAQQRAQLTTPSPTIVTICSYGSYSAPKDRDGDGGAQLSAQRARSSRAVPAQKEVMEVIEENPSSSVEEKPERKGRTKETPGDTPSVTQGEGRRTPVPTAADDFIVEVERLLEPLSSHRQGQAWSGMLLKYASPAEIVEVARRRAEDCRAARDPWQYLRGVLRRGGATELSTTATTVPELRLLPTPAPQAAIDDLREAAREVEFELRAGWSRTDCSAEDAQRWIHHLRVERDDLTGAPTLQQFKARGGA